MSLWPLIGIVLLVVIIAAVADRRSRSGGVNGVRGVGKASDCANGGSSRSRWNPASRAHIGWAVGLCQWERFCLLLTFLTTPAEKGKKTGTLPIHTAQRKTIITETAAR